MSAMARYKQRKGFENKLRALSRLSYKTGNAWGVSFDWADRPTCTQRTFEVTAGSRYGIIPQVILRGVIVRCTFTKWRAVVHECRIVDTPAGYATTNPDIVRKENRKFTTPTDLQEYLLEEIKALKFERLLGSLNV